MSAHTVNPDQDSGHKPEEPRHAAPPTNRRFSRRTVTAIGVVVAVIAAVVAVIANISAIGNLSIVSGWFPPTLAWVTIGIAVLALVVRKDVLREFAIGLPIGIGLTIILLVVLQVTQEVPSGAPRSLYVWLIVACVVAGLLIGGWHRANWYRRIAGVLAVALAVITAGSSANLTFEYYPTFDRLFGQTADNFIDNAQLTAIREEVRKTGKLPDHGETLSVNILDPNLRFQPRPAYVWVPPAFFARSRPQLPVIELLHGTPGQPSDWTRAAFADQTSMAFAAQNKGVAPILVMPDVNGSLTGDTECMNSGIYGQVENYLTQTVPAYMRKNFNAKTSDDSVAIAGLSEGGLCATTLSLNNPKVYAAFGNYSGDVSPTNQQMTAQQTIATLFGGSMTAYDAHNPPYLLTHNTYKGLSGWFAAGAQDLTAVKALNTLAPLSVKAGIQTCYTTPPGHHAFQFWDSAFQQSLPWLSWKLKLTPEPKSIPATCTGH
jgi:S-formylglutathione hydrolase FrmB